MEFIGAGAIILIVFGIFLIPTIFFLITQQNTLKAIQPQNRTMSPGEVWLQLIPLFNLVWAFIVVNRIAESLRRELSTPQPFSFEENQFQASYYESTEKPTQQIGTAMCVLNCCAFIPFIGILARIAGIVCWIVYWVKLSEYKNQITSTNYLDYQAPVQHNRDQVL